MLPYWLLFLIFAAGAIRFGAAPITAYPAAPPDPPEQQGHHAWERLGRGARLLPVAAAIAALMVGLRFGVGTDWGAYITIYKDIARSDFLSSLVRIDPAYGALNWIAAQLGGGIWFVNLACALLFMFGLVRFARAQPNPWLAIAVAVPYLIIGVGMGYTRQAVAIAFGMAGIAALSRGASLARFLLWVLAAALFHRTAVILIPIVAMAYTRNRLHSVLLGILGAVGGYYMLTLGQGLEHFQGVYISHVYESQGAGVRLAMNLPPSLIYLGASRRFTGSETERRIWRNFAVIAIFSVVALFLVASSVIVDRLALYIIPIQLFVLSRLPNVLSRTGRPTLLLVSCVLLYSAVVQFVWLNFANNSKNWIPYESYFSSACRACS